MAPRFCEWSITIEKRQQVLASAGSIKTTARKQKAKNADTLLTTCYAPRTPAQKMVLPSVRVGLLTFVSLIKRVSLLISLLGAIHRDQATQLSHTGSEPRSILSLELSLLLGTCYQMLNYIAQL